MAATAAGPAPRRSRRPVVRSAHLRLTLLYSGMFLILGTVIVVVIFVIGSGSAATSVSQAAPHAAGGVAPVVHAAVSQQHAADVNRLLASAWATLVLTAAVSAVLGWFVARRALRPLRQMTAAARTISAGSLHERLALEGPADEFKQLGDTIDDLLARLEASFAAQRRFVANAAHELRTPLTIERTLLQVALADPQASAASLRATCHELLTSGREQERLIDSLLALASSERGLETRTTVDLAAVVGAVVDRLRSAAAERSVTLAGDLQPALVRGDVALIEGLATNLLENAVHYNRPGGHVSIRTAAESTGTLFTVTNAGPHVPPGEVEGLFEPFRRLHSDRVAAAGHHGLGLSIVRAVATAHGATASATPNPLGGLTVTVAFPGCPPPPAGGDALSLRSGG